MLKIGKNNGEFSGYPELAENNGILAEDEAMSVAADARRTDTQWSCVYNLDEFTLDICLDKDYETKHSFSRNDFK